MRQLLLCHNVYLPAQLAVSMDAANPIQNAIALEDFAKSEQLSTKTSFP